jgi:hypothetical protein
MVRIEIIAASLIMVAVVGSLAVITINPIPNPVSTTTITTTTASSFFSSSTTTTSTTSSVTTSYSNSGQGIANGTINIGPLQPTCAINSTKGPPPSSIAYIEAIITSPTGDSIRVPLDWSVYAKCEAVGKFHIALPPGSYSLDLNSCIYLSCKDSLPKGFVVSPNKITVVNVSIDTGIR